MKLRMLRPVAVTASILCCAAMSACLLTPASAQVYRNIVNQRFRTVADGPQSALIVDVADPNDQAAVRRAVDTQVSAFMRSVRPSLQREVAFLQRHRMLKPGRGIPFVTTVLLRHNGRLVLPPTDHQLTRQPPAGNNLTFVANTTGNFAFPQAGSGLYTASTLDNLMNNVLYPALKSILGPPLWSGANGQPGQVTVLNEDPDPNDPHHVDSIIGVVVVNNGGNIQIELPTFSADQDAVLGLLQAMAQTFNANAPVGYDAWEMGMGRAVAVVAAQRLQAQLQQILPQGDLVDPAAGFYYTPYYDILNQPALGNNTFLPPTKSGQVLTGLGGMLVPRLQMSSSAWLKCYVENNQFFSNFNAAYFDAINANPTGNVPNDVNQLRALAKQALAPATTVEGQDFDTWFEQQYVLDTSVTPGPKLYAFTTPTLPDPTHSAPDGAAVTLLYFQTTTTGDELDLSGVCSPIFFDYTYQNRLDLNGADVPFTISGGEGDTAPLFAGVGGTQQNPQVLIAMDFTVDNNYQRVYFPANADSTPPSSDTPTAFFGAVVGANSNPNTGQLTAVFNGGSPITLQVAQSAFDSAANSSIPNNFTKVQLTYQPLDANGHASGQPITYYRNVYQRADQSSSGGLPNVSSLFVLVAPAPVETLPAHTFLNAPQLISIPILPLNHDLAAVFGIAPNQTLLAQWRQNATPSPDQYLRYPSLPLYQPGYGLWTNFTQALNSVSITGAPTDNQPVVEVGLQYGWNMIGNPFVTGNLSLTNDPTNGGGGIQFVDQGGNAYTLQDAITNQLIAQGIWGYDPGNLSTAAPAQYEDVTGAQLPTTSPFTPNTLQPWYGYWIRVVQTDGLTLSYFNPKPNTRAALPPNRAIVSHKSSRAVRAPERGGWRIPLFVQDENGNAAYATMGQSPRGSDQYVPALDTASPPPFSRAPTLRVRFPHTDWDAGVGPGGGDFLSDIRRSATSPTWDVAVDVPEPGKNYVLAWNNTARLPRGTRLTLVDLDNNTRQLMNSTSSYSFTASQGETIRRFQIIAEAHGLSLLAITNLRVDTPPAAPGRSVSSATISYEIDGVAEASIQIRGPSGRVLRHLAQGRAATAGVNQMVWDLRDDRGRSLPSGVYLVEVQARTPEGRQTRAIMPHQIVR